VDHLYQGREGGFSVATGERRPGKAIEGLRNVTGGGHYATLKSAGKGFEYHLDIAPGDIARGALD
jgi:hypothetical protein